MATLSRSRSRGSACFQTRLLTMFDLTGKVALVTGAASGIGEAIALTFAKRGAFVYVADIDEPNGRRVANEITNDNGHAAFIKLNVTETHDCENAAKQVLSDHDKLDILVNNAGVGHVGSIEKTTADDLDRLYVVNVRGMFTSTKAFIPSMLERKHGVIVNMSSVG